MCFDPTGKWTLGISIGINFTLFYSFSFSFSFCVDDNGNMDFQATGSTKGFGIVDAGAGITIQATNKDTVYDLYGTGIVLGASGGPSWYVGCDVISSSGFMDEDAKIEGIQITAGVGVGIDVHICVTNTYGCEVRIGKRTLKEWKYMYDLLFEDASQNRKEDRLK